MYSIEMNLTGTLKKKFTDLENQANIVQVGYLEDENLNKIAMIQEYGATIKVTPKMQKWFIWIQKDRPQEDKFIPKLNSTLVIPPRAFMNITFGKFKDSWKKQLIDLLNKSNIEDALLELGITIKKQIQSVIKSNVPPSNHSFTAWKKNHTNTLIGLTENMHDKIDIRVSRE